MSARDMLVSVGRRIVPKAIRLEIYRARHAAAMRKYGDRRFLEHEIFPWLGALGVRELLSIGCRHYTSHYEKLLARYNIEMTTVDYDPTAARYGARRHLTADVTKLNETDFEAVFDAILFNGVIGFGLDDPISVDAGLCALVALMRPGATFVSGWTPGYPPEPTEATYRQVGLTQAPGPTGTSRVAFAAPPHVYDFLVKATS